MTRNTVHFRKQENGQMEAEDAEEGEDDVAELKANTVGLERVNVTEWVVYSSTYQLPVFYFGIHDASMCGPSKSVWHTLTDCDIVDGSPLSVEALMRTSLFDRGALDGGEVTTFGVQTASGTFAALSQGDHPVLGTPSWYLHPCEMAGILGEILEEKESGGDRGMTLVEAWMMVVGGTVNLVGQ
jgi:ubiquitin-like-conjugating enzyme ATG10